MFSIFIQHNVLFTYRMISIIVCTYNRIQYLPKTLLELKNQSVNNESYEVLIVDNNSTDGTWSVCEKILDDKTYDNFRLISEPNQGLSYARNRGVKESTGELIVFLDDDAFPVPIYLESITSFFSIKNNIFCAGGKILPLYEKKPKWMNRFLNPLFAFQDKGDAIKTFGTNEFPIGANMIFEKSIFDKYGLFRTDLGRKGNDMGAGEEKDFINRLRKGGERLIYLPEAEVTHVIPENRVSDSYIRKQAIGSGLSEMKRVSQIGRLALIAKIISEEIKWWVTLGLFLFYLGSFQISKGIMLFKFRFWVTKGMLSYFNAKFK